MVECSGSRFQRAGSAWTAEGSHAIAPSHKSTHHICPLIFTMKDSPLGLIVSQAEPEWFGPTSSETDLLRQTWWLTDSRPTAPLEDTAPDSLFASGRGRRPHPPPIHWGTAGTVGH